MQCALQEKIKGPYEGIQLARTVSNCRKGHWWKGNLLGLKCINFCKSLILMFRMKSDLKERRKNPPLLVRRRKLHRMADGLWETQLQIPKLIQAQ